MEVLINNRQKKIRFDLRTLRKIALEMMKFEGAPENSELSLVLCDDDFIQKLNHDHLGVNRPTDVLSFPLDADEHETEIRLLGDIVISVETAVRQAAKLKHSVEFEVTFLLVHGLLHLMGYDHKTGPGLKRMKVREETLCNHLFEKRILQCSGPIGQSTLIRRSVEPPPGKPPKRRIDA